jgi:hypothetical protein
MPPFAPRCQDCREPLSRVGTDAWTETPSYGSSQAIKHQDPIWRCANGHEWIGEFPKSNDASDGSVF